MKFEIKMTPGLLRHKITNDMWSLLNAPLILRSPEALKLQSLMRESVSRFMDLDGERIFRMIDTPEPRLPLGKWFERIFLAALRITFPFGGVYHSVSDGHGGELDFVIKNIGLGLHIECAVKFFLYEPHRGSGLSSYVGPGGQDRLDLKYQKMRDVQLRRHIPPTLNDGRDFEKILWMGGRIHYPFEAAIKNISGINTEISGEHLSGYWGSRDQIIAGIPRDAVLTRLPRQWWMTTLSGLRGEDLACFEMEPADGELPEPQMTAIVRVNERSIVTELGRGFVMPAQK